jgi:1-aminocyclopropane-1-carboxylate deaminase/D-cysteine desulfhydrase-like pyridoxal-dependent ACC family enzyme
MSGNLPANSGNYLLDKLFNPEIVWALPGERDKILQMTFDKAWEQGRRPYLIPYGGSNATGAVGYALAIKEMLEQCQTHPHIPYPNWICVASSSGGTQAGLVAGAKLFGYQGEIIGISIDEQAPALQNHVAVLATEVCDLLGEPYSIKPGDIRVLDEFLGMGYGVMGEAEIHAINTFARTEGILLDPVYTGRAAAGLISLVRDAYFPKEGNILFWHTGGAPALFADAYLSIVT